MREPLDRLLHSASDFERDAPVQVRQRVGRLDAQCLIELIQRELSSNVHVTRHIVHRMQRGARLELPSVRGLASALHVSECRLG